MSLLRVASVFLAVALAGCPAVYPELGTRTHTIPAGQPLDPPPPSEMRWIKFLSARVPERTRDGRPWQANGKASPYAKLLANGVEVLHTSPQSDTLAPTWPGAPHGNFKILPGDRLRVELWDTNPVDDKPIGARELGAAGDLAALDGRVSVDFEEGTASSGSVTFAFEPAHAVSGLGLWYELRTAGCNVTRLLEGSPSERAGILPGDEVVRIGDREAKAMSPDELKSAFNAVPLAGLKLTIRHAQAGNTAELVLKEGPIYPSFAQFGPVE
jgi:hypothetical protein